MHNYVYDELEELRLEVKNLKRQAKGLLPHPAPKIIILDERALLQTEQVLKDANIILNNLLKKETNHGQ